MPALHQLLVGMMNGLVTVIVPVYCVEEIILKRCIESILEQTYKNLEVYLIDDGTPDNSGKICDIYAQKDNRIIVEHLENGGVSKARNHALGMAKGNYIMFVDSDDYINPKCVEELLHCMIENNADCTICATNYVDEKGKVDKSKSIIKETKILGQKEALDLSFPKTDFPAASVHEKNLLQKGMIDDQIISRVQCPLADP